MGNVVMLTGAAGTGKSTLTRHVADLIAPLCRIDFGQRLLDLKTAQGHRDLTYERLRKESAALISSEDVAQVDTRLITDMPALRATTNVLIDSHSVTQESFGYRITHYSFDQLRDLRLDAVVCLYCDPSELVARRMRDPEGRPALSPFEAQHHMSLQESVAINYAIVCGCRCYMLDTTSRLPEQLALSLQRIINGEPSIP